MENNLQKKSNCPICDAEINKNPRYEKEVCMPCQNKATDIYSRKLLFYEYLTVYEDNGKEYKSNLCFINSIECFYYNRYFGGVVIEKREGQKMDIIINGD